MAENDDKMYLLAKMFSKKRNVAFLFGLTAFVFMQWCTSMVENMPLVLCPLRHLSPWPCGTNVQQRMLVLSAKQKCNRWLVRQFHPNPKWARYQLADYLKGKIHDYSIPKGSIMEELRSHKHESLSSAVRERVASAKSSVFFFWKNQLPKPNTVVIHLRVGDVVDMAVESLEDMVENGSFYYREKATSGCCDEPWKHPKQPPHYAPWNSYVKPLSHFEFVVRNREVLEARNVVIMASIHKGQVPWWLYWRTGATRSCQYTVAVQEFFQRRLPKANVVLRVGMSPDDDIVFSSQAAVFVRSGGGFSELIAGVVRRFGGTVV